MFMQPSGKMLTDAELDELQELLLGPEEDDDNDNDNDEDVILGIDELHGFLTAVLCAPDVIMPSEYMPRVFGDREWRSMEEAQQAMGLLMRLYNEINDDLRAGEFEPLLMQSTRVEDKTVLIADDWCHGFLRGMALRDEAWRPSNNADEFTDLIMPIVFLGANDPSSPAAQLGHAHHDELVARLPESIHGLYKYMRKRHTLTRKTAPKTGRNELCPCGSGKKYKKCCGSGDKGPLLH